MGRFDDNLWDVRSPPKPSLFQNRTNNRAAQTDLISNLFKASSVARPSSAGTTPNNDQPKTKKRPSTFHVYGLKNTLDDLDFLDIVGRSRRNRQLQSSGNRVPLGEIDGNISKSNSKLDKSSSASCGLIDLKKLVSSSQSLSSTPNGLQRTSQHNSVSPTKGSDTCLHEVEAAGPAEPSTEHERIPVESGEDQLNSDENAKDANPTGLEKTKSNSDENSIRNKMSISEITNVSQEPPKFVIRHDIDDEADEIANSEEEPEFLSPTISSNFSSRYSTSRVPIDETFDTVDQTDAIPNFEKASQQLRSRSQYESLGVESQEYYYDSQLGNEEVFVHSSQSHYNTEHEYGSVHEVDEPPYNRPNEEYYEGIDETQSLNEVVDERIDNKTSSNSREQAIVIDDDDLYGTTKDTGEICESDEAQPETSDESASEETDQFKEADQPKVVDHYEKVTDEPKESINQSKEYIDESKENCVGPEISDEIDLAGRFTAEEESRDGCKSEKSPDFQEKVVNTKKRKNVSLREMCSRINQARLPSRVGLSKRVKIDSLHKNLTRK
ncbi:hypothetical protein QCA50_016276 [Cerrena zonata]|uniref:Uncharacterized protein n=1 Tax=Cerrena zonata TaxID=2478898 RepID=A0AAW0FG53_9APHY